VIVLSSDGRAFQALGAAVPVPWQRGHTGPKGSTVVHRWIGACSVTKELETSGMHDVWGW